MMLAKQHVFNIRVPDAALAWGGRRKGGGGGVREPELASCMGVCEASGQRPEAQSLAELFADETEAGRHRTTGR
eukprot:2714814-Rhodomonas_salina.2